MMTFQEFINAVCFTTTNPNPVKKFWEEMNPSFRVKTDFSISVNAKLTIYVKKGSYDERVVRSGKKTKRD